jgi:glutamyl-tRNA synthetase
MVQVLFPPQETKRDLVMGKGMGIPDLPRIAPEPSGYLHIGHLKAAILNRFLADQYQGQFILRFDDTNPLKEDEEFEQTIKEDLAMIEIGYDKVVHTSDHFDKIQEHTERLIRQGDAFMDDTDGETVSWFYKAPGRRFSLVPLQSSLDMG